MNKLPVPVYVRPKAKVCGRSPSEIVGLNPAEAWMFVCCGRCVLSGRGLCDELKNDEVTTRFGSQRKKKIPVKIKQSHYRPVRVVTQIVAIVCHIWHQWNIWPPFFS